MQAMDCYFLFETMKQLARDGVQIENIYGYVVMIKYYCNGHFGHAVKLYIVGCCIHSHI